MLTGLAYADARGAPQPPVLDRGRGRARRSLRYVVGPARPAHAGRAAGVLRRHVGVRLAELDAQRRAGRVAGRHVAAVVGTSALRSASRCCRSSVAHCSPPRRKAAWPLLDSLTTWFSLLATWLAARAKLENWLYWIAIDGVLVFLFYVQELPFLALLNVLFIGIAAGGLRRLAPRLQLQAVPA